MELLRALESYWGPSRGKNWIAYPEDRNSADLAQVKRFEGVCQH
jgi:hypothetical protein